VFDAAAALARRVGTTPLVAQVLHNRGIDDPDQAKAFLRPKLNDLHDPALLSGAQAAARRIAQAVAGKQAIVLYGDYDVDGITGVAILYALLGMVGGRVDYYVPHRLEEGYGVNAEAVRKLIAGGVKLLITVDCGISAGSALAEAQQAGVDVIITDHHGVPPRLPPAAAIVHPALPGGTYPNPNLSGAGAAFKLAWQAAREICGETRVDEAMRNFLLDATCLAALGTIADVVPLIGENRTLATFGLRGLPSSRHVGLRALIESAGLAGGTIDAYHVGFVLAPRLNACGRMGHARLAVELLTSASPQRSREIAEYLGKQNAERQKVEREIAQQAEQMVRDRGMDRPEHRAIVLASRDWHGGVIGIVASRLVGLFGRPAILIAVNGEGGQGSGRSICGFHLCEALSACREHLEGFGGHAMAGGLKIAAEKIDAFTGSFLEYARLNISEEQLVPALHIDAETTLSGLSYAVAESLERMAPFGQGNPPPLVLLRGCRVVGPPRRMGRNAQALGLVLGQNAATLRAVGFGMGDLAQELVGIRQIDVVGQPVLNTFNGKTSVEIRLKDVRWE